MSLLFHYVFQDYGYGRISKACPRKFNAKEGLKVA